MPKYFSRNLFGILLVQVLLSSPVYAGVEFDGVDDCVGSTTSITYGTNVLSLSLWAFYTDSGGNDIIFETTVNAGSNAPAILLVLPSTATAGSCDGSAIDGIIFSGGGAREECLNDRPAANEWHHYVAIFDNSTENGDVKIYVDGVEETLVIGTNTASGTSNYTSANSYIGFRACVTSSAYTGLVSEVFLYQGALSDSEIRLLGLSRVKRTGLQIDNTKLFMWPLDDQSDGTSADGTVFSDISGNGETATGDDGANNTGLTAKAEEVLTYPPN